MGNIDTLLSADARSRSRRSSPSRSPAAGDPADPAQQLFRSGHANGPDDRQWRARWARPSMPPQESATIFTCRRKRFQNPDFPARFETFSRRRTVRPRGSSSPTTRIRQLRCRHLPRSSLSSQCRASSGQGNGSHRRPVLPRRDGGDIPRHPVVGLPIRPADRAGAMHLDADIFVVMLIITWSPGGLTGDRRHSVAVAGRRVLGCPCWSGNTFSVWTWNWIAPVVRVDHSAGPLGSDYNLAAGLTVPGRDAGAELKTGHYPLDGRNGRGCRPQRAWCSASR